MAHMIDALYLALRMQSRGEEEDERLMVYFPFLLLDNPILDIGGVYRTTIGGDSVSRLGAALCKRLAAKSQQS